MLGHRLSAVATALVFATLTTANSPPPSTACAAVASASASYFSANPSATGAAQIPAQIAYDCLNSVPNYKDPAIAFVQSLKAWFQIHCSVDYVKNPLSGYLWPGVDMIGQLDVIIDNINNGKYDSEYDFQLDVVANNYLTRDYHFVVGADLFSQVIFTRANYDLVSISSDGKALPDVWLWEDLFGFDDKSNVVPTGCNTCSPVTQVNGMDLNTFLTYSMNVVQSHDPDSMYNQIMWNAAFNLNPDGGIESPWNFPQWYPGPTTTMTFQNGTKITFTNEALLEGNWTGIETGDDAYQAFCVHQDTWNGPPAASASSSTKTKRTIETDKTKRATPSATVYPSYPDPVVIDPTGILSGYYLDGNYSDVAVLAIRTFEIDNDNNFVVDIQNALQAFFAKTIKDKMKYLVLDLQGNGGGFVDLGTELVAQMFPHDEPNTKTTMRQSSGLSAVLTKFGQEHDAIDANSTIKTQEIDDDIDTPFAWQSVMDPTAASLGSNKDFLTSPYKFDNAEFTAFFQNNYSNTDPSDLGGSITITSTNDRTGFAQPFAAQNIIILTEGYCGSTCSVVAEMLKNLHGIQFITVGGRPQTGPMQAVGNTKGTQVYETFQLEKVLYAWYDDSQFPIERNTLPAGDPFANASWNHFAIDRGLSRVNGRNGYRIGDPSNIVKQMVYEASDCRVWYTAAMISDPTVLWAQTADLAFNQRGANGLIDSPLCVADSVGDPTSGSGGATHGQLGPQNPPANAASKYPTGWLLNGNSVVTTWSPNRMDGGAPGVVNGVAANQDPKTFYLKDSSPSSSSSSSSGDASDGSDDAEGDAKTSQANAQQPLMALHNACQGYKGDKWLMSLVCGRFG